MCQYLMFHFLTKKTVVKPPPAKECLLQVFNLVNGEPVSVEILGHNIFPDKIESNMVRFSIKLFYVYF